MENPFIDQREIHAKQLQEQKKQESEKLLQRKIISIKQYDLLVTKVLTQLKAAKYTSLDAEVKTEQHLKDDGHLECHWSLSYTQWAYDDVVTGRDSVKVSLKLDNHDEPISFTGFVDIGRLMRNSIYGYKSFECSLSEEALVDTLKQLHSDEYFQEARQKEFNKAREKIMSEGIKTFFAYLSILAIPFGIIGGILGLLISKTFVGGLIVSIILIDPILSWSIVHTEIEKKLQEKKKEYGLI